jgi:elongation factor Ts
MSYTAQDVKKLREETDAPMMECKAALEEADGDFARAKEILREKGKASAGKKAGRETNAGRVGIVLNDDATKAGVALVESETDFVSNNEGFVGATNDVAKKALAEGTLSDEQKKELGDDIIAKFRENCVVKVADQMTTSGKLSSYVHHDGSKGAIIESEGDAAGSEAIRKLAVQVVASPPQVVSKDDLSKELLDSEYQIQYTRAIGEGKPANIAENIAKGRVNKEFIKEAVLMEQPFYADPSKTVGQYLAEEAKNTKVLSFRLIRVGS